jgi:ribosome biogenesis GTPase
MARSVPLSLVPFGWNARVDALLADHLEGRIPARVVRVERSACRVVTPDGEMLAVSYPLPAVGDWVALEPSEPPSVAHVAERWSALTRLDPHGDRVQVLAADIDLVLVTCPCDRPSITRVERECVIGWESGARPIVVVTKADLGAAELVADLRRRLVDVEVLPTALVDRTGVDEIAARLAPDRTAVMLGPSGAGKSSLINALLGEDRLATGAVREDDARGRHTTTARELVVIPTGGVVIDTPGIRGVGLTADGGVGLETAFADIVALAAACRFRDCSHTNEPGCAVVAALVAGGLERERYDAYTKLDREVALEVQRTDPVAAKRAGGRGRGGSRRRGPRPG